MAYVMEGVPAGSTISGLEIQCCDASGRAVPEGTAGKLRATWIRGTKKLQFDESGRFGLLALEVRLRSNTTHIILFHILSQGMQQLVNMLAQGNLCALRRAWQGASSVGLF